MAEVKFSAEAALRESVVVAVVTASGQEQFTVHRPIGVTDLAADEWVVTRTVDVPSLLARAERPDKKTVDEERTRALYAAAAGDVQNVTLLDGVLLLGGQPRPGLTRAARQAAVRAAGEGRVPAADAYISHLPEELREVERSLREFLSSERNITRAAEAHPYAPYCTRSGPTAAQDQVAKAAWKGRSLAQVRDALNVLIAG
jgi:hypothetical protein